MDKSIFIETSRLLLRGWHEADLEDLIQMNADPEVMRFFPEPYSEDRSRDQYRLIQNEFEQVGFGLYAAEAKCSGEFMGYIGFHQASLQVDFCPCVEIAWRLAKRFWNQGYATEGAAACLAHGWNRLDFERVYSFTAVLNLPSQRVMQKSGMQLNQYFDNPELPPDHPLGPHVCYVATKPGSKPVK